MWLSTCNLFLVPLSQPSGDADNGQWTSSMHFVFYDEMVLREFHLSHDGIGQSGAEELRKVRCVQCRKT